MLGLGGLTSCGGSREKAYPTPRSSLHPPSVDERTPPLSFDSYLASPGDEGEGTFVPRVVSAKVSSDSARKPRHT